MSPIRPTQGALVIECSCGRKVGGVRAWAEGVEYTPVPTYYEKHLRSGFDTAPPNRIFDATKDGNGSVIGRSKGTARIICKCGKDRVLTDASMRNLVADRRKPTDPVRLS